ncbi:MAG: alpha/beta fold hydrolase [Kiritimatiellae bacterium]|nr:alpha/beta fold hydrolase [Kiritimatiellia bacterium]
MKINHAPAFAALALCSAALAGEVSVKEDRITLPTYAPGGYDKTPLFYTGRVYQGAQGRVYPYPMQDVLHDGKIDETYKYLTLENDWFQAGLLPEHGGHLLNFTDKASGYETFYRQHVIKPALIGMLGAWISGGVEWNFPHHHRATTAMPIDWRLVENKDGSKTVWIGETELRRRLKWTIGLSLLPDRAVLRAENVFMNRQPWIESMIYWANVSVHCGEDYQILFPPSMHLGFDHHKNYWTSFPIGPRKEEVELLPSQRSKYADDISGTMDLSWWKNFTIESRSIFGMDPDNAFMAGYDHKKQCGTAHVSNRHITVGKKFFLWGNFPEAHVWDTVLTDSDGPYLELMVGCWSDNQPDYSWIAPYETRKVEQFWFPVKGIGGIKNATIDGAVNVDRLKSDELLVGFHSTRALKGCTVRVTRKSSISRTSSSSRTSCDSRAIFTESNIAIDPNKPWCKTVKVAADAKDQEFTAEIADASGKVFLSYTPVPPQGEVELPPKVENPKEPKEYTSAELAYEVGLRLDQFQNGLIDPEPYYKRALEIDPDYTKANLAMGVRLAKNGSYAAAKPYLEKAVARATQNHTRALDAAPEYYLALVERGLASFAASATEAKGNLKRAEDLFWRCTWRLTHKKESYVEIARIAALRGDWEEALARIDDALALGQDEAKLWTMKGIFLRKHMEISRRGAEKPRPQSGGHVLGSASDSMPKTSISNLCELCSSASLREINDPAVCFEKAIKCDPLEYWAVVERDGFAAAEKNRGLKAQQLLECISDYWGIGCYDEVIALCDAALAKAAAEKPYATEGALPLKDTIAACDSYKNALFGYFKGAAILSRAESQSRREKENSASLRLSAMQNEALACFSAAAAMPTDYCFPNRLEEEEVLVMATKAAPELANTWYYLGCCEWNHDRKDAGLVDWKRCVSLCEAENSTRSTRSTRPTNNPSTFQPFNLSTSSSYALALRCIGFGLSHPGTYFTNTGIPSGVPSKEAYDYYIKSLEADPGNFRTLDEAGKLAEKLNLPAAERLALMEKYKATVYKYDACVLRLAYTYNAVGRYAEAHEILTTRRFHVWEGADGLLAPFVESCIGLGKAAMAKGDFKAALKHFEESTTYPANLQAGRPGDAGTEPKSRYFMAQCKKALGDEAGYRKELENSLKGWIHAGEMDYWRVKALRELGRGGEAAPLIAELKQAIKELETPQPTVINAYAKFAGDNSAMERAAKAREKAGALRKLLAEIEAKERPLRGKIAGRCRITKEDTWHGHRRTHFDFNGRKAWVVEPSVAPAKGMPWTWTMQWAEAFVERTRVPDLLARGFHHVTIDVFNTRMNDEGLKVCAAFQDFLVKELGFAEKANLIGMSWGGFFSVRYAHAHPQSVRRIYLDAPLLNFDGFKPSAIGVWSATPPAGGRWTDDPRMPVNMAEAVAKSGIPVLLLYGGRDQVVPPAANCEPFAARFRKSGGRIDVIRRDGYGHHPHGVDPAEAGVLLDFFLK